MKDHTWVKPINKGELNVYQYGHERCEKGYLYGPYMRDHFLIHFVMHGKGVFVLDGVSYEIKENQGFIIYPGEITYYQADEADPWTYRWVGFNGGNCEVILKNRGFNPKNPVFIFDNAEEVRKIFFEMKNVKEATKEGQLCLAGYLYMLFSKMLPTENEDGKLIEQSYATSKEYVAGAIDFIVKNYSNKMTVNDISEYIGLNRSYFGSIFKKHTNMSPQEFLIKFRLEKSSELLGNHKLSISDVARSVGYDDAMLFCKMFKKHYGLSPSEYRRKI